MSGSRRRIDPPSKRPSGSNAGAVAGNPPYLVQAMMHTDWVTDRTAPNIEEALRVAHQLHDLFGRRVRVIDQEEVVHFKKPILKSGDPKRPVTL